MLPLLVTIKDGVVDEVVVCQNSADLEAKFKAACKARGRKIGEDRLDDGYAEFEGGSVCMTWASPPQFLWLTHEVLGMRLRAGVTPAGVELRADYPPLKDNPEDQALVYTDVFGPNPRLQFLVYEPQQDEPAVSIRYNRDGSIAEVALRQDIQQKVVQNDQDTAWMRERAAGGDC